MNPIIGATGTGGRRPPRKPSQPDKKSGNNKTGRRGKKRCQHCRKGKHGCDFKRNPHICDRCLDRRLPCSGGEMTEMQRSTDALSTALPAAELPTAAGTAGPPTAGFQPGNEPRPPFHANQNLDPSMMETSLSSPFSPAFRDPARPMIWEMVRVLEQQLDPSEPFLVDLRHDIEPVYQEVVARAMQDEQQQSVHNASILLSSAAASGSHPSTPIAQPHEAQPPPTPRSVGRGRGSHTPIPGGRTAGPSDGGYLDLSDGRLTSTDLQDATNYQIDLNPHHTTSGTNDTAGLFSSESPGYVLPSLSPPLPASFIEAVEANTEGNPDPSDGFSHFDYHHYS